MPIDVSVIGSSTNELEDLVRASGARTVSAATSDLLRLAQPESKPPQVVVLDIRQQPQVPPALALLKREHPATGVVIVAGKLEPTVMLEAMRAGVTEWVTDPVVAKDLAAAIERAAGAASPVALGEVFAVVGAKGGVGATTVAVNIATTLASIAKGSTLLIDLHPSGGDAALYLGAEAKFSVLDALDNTHRLDETFLKGLVVKTGGTDLLASADRPAARPVDPHRIRAVVEAAMRCYRFVVLDVPREYALAHEALDVASSITVVTTQELAAIRNASRAAAALREHHGADRVRVVVNRYDRAAEIAPEDLERAIGGRIGHRFPSNYRLAIAALNKGRPLVTDNHNNLASAFAAYARSLSGQASTPDTRPSGLLGKLTGRR